MALQVLSEAQCEKIFYASLEILERTGVEVFDDQALEILKKAGCWVDGNRVRIPAAKVEKALQTAPSRVTLCNNRTGERVVHLESHNAYFGTGSDTPYYIDPYTNEKKKTTKESVSNSCKIIDYLPNMDFVMSAGIVQDVDQKIHDRHQFEAQIKNTSKPIIATATDKEGFEDIIEMCEYVMGGEEELKRNPIMGLYIEPSSPLQHSYEAVSKLIITAEKEVPAVYTPCIMAGATAPVTLAGVLATGIAESLSGLVIHQQVNEGAPFIKGGVYTIMDMNSTIFSYGAPEFDLMQSALADICHYLKLPMFGTCGCSDSKSPDEQDAIESAFSILATQLSGSNLNHDVGYIEYGMTTSWESLVICDDIIGMVRRAARGILVNDETLGMDAFDEVGPSGHFLTTQHTKKWFKREFYDTWDHTSSLMDRRRYDNWAADGKKRLFDRANEKVKDILENYEPEPLPQDAAKKIEEIVKRAEDKHL